MKKRIYMLFVMAMIMLAMAGCGSTKQRENLDFTGIIRDINLSMTREDVIELERSQNGAECSAEKIYEGDTVLYYENAVIDGWGGTLFYRIEEAGTIGFVQFQFDYSQEYDLFMEDFREQYGESHKVKDYYEVWYGVVADGEATFSTLEAMSLIEIARR